MLSFSVVILVALQVSLPLVFGNEVSYPACRLVRAVEKSGESVQRVVAIGDVHGEAQGFKNILFHAGIIGNMNDEGCSWKPQSGKGTKLVQVGDIVDRGPDAIGAWECIKQLQANAPEGSEVIRLVGNHELWWLNGQIHDRNKKTDTKMIVSQIIEELKSSIVQGTVQAAFRLVLHDVDIVFVHAGFRKKFIERILPPNFQGNEAEVLVAHANEVLQKGAIRCDASGSVYCSISGETFDAGPERGGRSIGGPFWTDFSVVYEEQNNSPSSYVQIVGHTASRYHEIRSSRGLTSICVDTGMYFGGRGFFEIGNDGRFRVYKIAQGAIEGVDVFDLTEQTCDRGSPDFR